MKKLLKCARITTNYKGSIRSDNHFRIEKITVLKTTDKAWLIKFPVGEDIIQMWFPKVICVLWKNRDILSTPQWFYLKTYPKENLMWQENFDCKERI